MPLCNVKLACDDTVNNQLAGISLECIRGDEKECEKSILTRGKILLEQSKKRGLPIELSLIHI